MINYRKLKQDLSGSVLKEGQALFQDGNVSSVQIESISSDLVSLACSVSGNFDNPYCCKVEIDRSDSTLMDSECDCPYGTDCQHLAAVLFHLEKHFEDILIEFSSKAEAEDDEVLDAVRDAKEKQQVAFEKQHAEELAKEYEEAATCLSRSPFFTPQKSIEEDRAEIVLILEEGSTERAFHLRLALRLPYRAKPLMVADCAEFFDAVRYHEPLLIQQKQYFFSMRSFSAGNAQLFKMLLDFAEGVKERKECCSVDAGALGSMLAHAHDLSRNSASGAFSVAKREKNFIELSCICVGDAAKPLRLGSYTAQLSFDIEYMKVPAPKLFVKPQVLLGDEMQVAVDAVSLLECQKPGLLHEGIYYRFQPQVKRRHLKFLGAIEEMVIPEPLFGTFVENSLPELRRVAAVKGCEGLEQFVTLPFTGEVQGECQLQYLDGVLEASLNFLYDEISVPAAHSCLTAEQALSFIKKEGIVARNLRQEEEITSSLFQGFTFDEKLGCYTVKSDKKVIEFMTEALPRFAGRIKFETPKSLQGRFLYEETECLLDLSESKEVGQYSAKLKVNGALKGISVDTLWDCVATKKPYLELRTGKKERVSKILVLDLELISSLVAMFDELGLKKFDDYQEERPLWSLVSVEPELYKELPVTFKMSAGLKKMREQMLGETNFKPSAIPTEVKATLRDYQVEGVAWLERLRKMHLAGILADDMGLGKTLQAIAALSQFKSDHKESVSIVVCPTSLVYNWKAELGKFNPKLKVLVVDGTPTQRKKLLAKIPAHDVIVTSYTLLQKDVEHYQEVHFGYAILDEAQHIKNRSTRNAKSVKQLHALHRLILTGTPIENSLEELWSLFDFLMPGLLSSFERFSEKYIRSKIYGIESDLESLRRKVTPFILRRMKSDVLEELPPVSHIHYRCHLSETQQQLYRSYAESARKELSELVEREGFNKVQIQVLATLTRLKQICCHPAIFAKEKAEVGDSAKYDMMLELLDSLMSSGRKTVIFSQYTRMLQIMKRDFEKLGVRFSYLDGSTKNRLEIVNEFNEDPGILVFLVSLKAGGTGLNLTGADTVIHYDPWWNPAAEDQATDRVHRLGQKNNVSAYKLVTENTIEEKIQELQNKKRGLVKKVVSSDEEVLEKLSWDDVLELLKT